MGKFNSKYLANGFGSYFEVKISSTKASIGDINF